MSEETQQPQEETFEVGQPVNWYEFDWDNKVNTIEDLKTIFKSLKMTVSNKAEDFETLKQYVKDEVAYQTN